MRRLLVWFSTFLAVLTGVSLTGCVPTDPSTSARSDEVSAAPDGRPSLVAIQHDDYKAEYVGRLPDGRQFFLTWPFAAGTGGGSRDFIALYLFDRAGRLLDAQIEELPANLSDQQFQARLDARLATLGDVVFERIEVQPFTIERFGESFGLIATFDQEADMWWVTVEPGDYMAFSEPWDSGEYDT
ncbi:hypothetical protein [Cryptosporangium minutisporangium]